MIAQLLGPLGRCVAVMAFVACAAASSPGLGESAPSSAVTTATARVGQLSETVLAFGMLMPASSAMRNIAMPHDGFIEDVLSRPGDVLTKGQPVAVIAPTPMMAAQYDQAKSAAGYAQRTLARLERLRKSHLASNDQVAAAEKALRDAEATFAAENRMGMGGATQTLRAPMAGVITAIQATPGEQVMAGTMIATIGSRRNLVVNLGLEPEDAARLKPGAAIEFRVPLDDREKVMGRLLTIGAMIDPKSRLVPAIAEISNRAAASLTLGLTLVAYIALPPRHGVLVPRGAMLEDQHGSYLFTEEGGKAVYHHVTVGAETGRQSLIETGIAAGQRVIVSGNAALEDGMAVHEAKP